MVNGRLDPQKNAFAGNVPDLDALALHKLEYDFRYWQLLRRGHEVIPELTNGVFLEVLDLPRDPNPARVVFSVEPFLDACDPHTGLELRHDAAYWVSGLTVRGDDFRRGDKGTVDVTHARARRSRAGSAPVRDRQRQHCSSRVTSSGRTRRHTASTNGSSRASRFTPGPPQPVENGFTARFTRVAAVTLDLDAHGPRSRTGARRHHHRRRPHRVDARGCLARRGRRARRCRRRRSSSPTATRSRWCVTSAARSDWSSRLRLGDHLLVTRGAPRVPELRIGRVRIGDQLRVVAARDDPTVLEHDDAVGAFGHVEAVHDGDHGALPERGVRWRSVRAAATGSSSAVASSSTTTAGSRHTRRASASCCARVVDTCWWP